MEDEVFDFKQKLIASGLYAPDTMKKPVSNHVYVKASDYEGLLTKFPEQHRYKLRAYTGEELFYIYKLCMYKPRIAKDGCLANSSDVLLLALKTKIFKWLKGELRSGVNISILNRVGRKWRHQFYEFVIDSLTQDIIDNMTKEINAKRVG